MCQNSKEVFRYKGSNGKEQIIGGYDFCDKAKQIFQTLDNRKHAELGRNFSQQREYSCVAEYFYSLQKEIV